jgi:hypothetical protein
MGFYLSQSRDSKTENKSRADCGRLIKPGSDGIGRDHYSSSSSSGIFGAWT